MTRRVQDLELAATKGNPILVVILEVFPAQIAGARAMNPELGAGALLQRERAATVINMNMREQDFVDLVGAHGFGLLDNPIHVSVRTQCHIDDHRVVLADNILIGSLQGHHARIVDGKFSNVSWWSHYGPFSGSREKLPPTTRA